MPCKFFLAGLLALLLLSPLVYGAVKPPMVIVLIDASGSMVRFAPQVLKEVETLSNAPDGTEFAVYTVSSKVAARFKGKLSAETRLKILQTVAAVRYAGKTDFIGAFVEAMSAFREAGESDGTLVVLADGEDRAPQKTAPLPLSQIVADARLVPDNQRVVLRLFGAQSFPAIPRASVQVWRTVPPWSTFLKPSAVSCCAPVPDPPPPDPLPWRAAFAGAATVVLVVCGFLIHLARKSKAEEARLREFLKANLPDAAAQTVDRASLEKHGVRLQWNRGAGRPVEVGLFPEESSRVRLGEDWTADYESACGTTITFEVGADGACRIDNEGPAIVWLGQTPIPAGTSKVLPKHFSRLLAGDLLIEVLPATKQVASEKVEGVNP